MQKQTQLYEGKAKRVFATADPNLVVVDYKDDATAFNGEKKGTILGKGAINNRVTNHLMKLLEQEGIATHFVEELSDRETVVKKVTIVPLEVIVRNIAAGSFCKRFGAKEGTVLPFPTVEYSYKNDDLGDPLINRDHAKALGLSTDAEMDQIDAIAHKVNQFLLKHFGEVGIQVVDFKLEFGKTADGSLVLADEISPDTCRFWDKATGQKLDKDRFRQDLGGEEDAYIEIRRRLLGG